MWLQILKFELRYRSKRPATYIYFGILFFLAFMAISTDVVTIGGGTGLVKENAPLTIANMMVILSAFMMMITSAIMGVGVLRDFDHNTESLMFSNPISKYDYLIGRFLGSFIVTLFAFSGVAIGFIMGEFMPWRDADKLLPFNAWNYLHPFIFFVIPNLLFSGILFFFTGALSRRMMVVYIQWIILFVLYQTTVILTREIDNRALASIIDPFGLRTIGNATQYWTVAEQNSMTVPIEGDVLTNRLLWLGIAIAIAIIGSMSFSFNVVKSSWFKKKAKGNEQQSRTNIDIPQIKLQLGFSTYLMQIWKQAVFYFKYVTKGLPFLAISLFGLVLMITNSFYIGRVFGTYTYPTTALMLELITNGFSVFFVVIIVFYSGELIWRERDVKINLIQDSLPIPDFVGLISKFLGMIMVFVVMLVGLIASGVLIQAFKGYYEFNLGVYFTTLFTETFSALILFTLLGFFIQVMVNNKFLGHACMIVFFVVSLVLEVVGVEHGLFQFGSGALGPYSDMNGFGHFVTSFSWFDLYWLAFTVFLFALSVIFAVRGAEAAMKWRWHIGKLRLTKPLLTFGITSFCVFGLSGCYIYYNTNVLNGYANSDELEALQADYERTYKQYEYLPQPKVIDVNMSVELYPETRDYEATGYYVLENQEDEPIQEVHVQLQLNGDYHYDYVRFGRPSKIKEASDRFKYYIHELSEPLLPGDTTLLEFKMSFETIGFKETASATSVLHNGTFFNNTEFPTLGYTAEAELAGDDERDDNDLAPRDRMLPRDDPRGLSRNFLTDDSNGIDFEIVIGTSDEQIAIAPGYLQRQWQEEGRNYFHYKMDEKMMPFFSVVSADYEVMKDKTTITVDSVEKEIDLEIYYHDGHDYNLASMMDAMKKSFDYYSDNFSPYQYRQMRILEFPRYATFAQSFANTVPFSEGIGFMIKVEDEDDVDISYFVTAHELAHQWWGHQLYPADVQGSAMILESLSQYSALMVMKRAYPQEHMQEFLKEELNRYLTGRAGEQKKELPLVLAENQSYIHYGKGANIMYTLQDYIGEDSVNVALRRLLEDWGGQKGLIRDGRYVTTDDLMGYFREVTPDSLQNMVTDMFEKIVLFENKIEDATYTKVDGGYRVALELDVQKVEADSIGYTNDVAVNDWIDVGVYAENDEGDEVLVYLKKHKITQREASIVIEVEQEPVNVGIDPLYKLIDRNPDDNITSAREVEEEAI